MSFVYNVEPPTSGKVTLTTSLGDITIELWSKECPLACRNFVQLCLEGYYNNLPFHRVIPGFLVQAGDKDYALESSKGGESVYGEPFKDEINSRLRFSHRGIVGCASSSEKKKQHSNLSQFFITLSPTLELAGKYTIFGRVSGDSIYTVLRVGEWEGGLGEGVPCITGVNVVDDPFGDIVCRRSTEVKVGKRTGIGMKKRKRGNGGINRSLLSFSTGSDIGTIPSLDKTVKTDTDNTINTTKAKNTTKTTSTITSSSTTTSTSTSPKVSQSTLTYEQLKGELLSMRGSITSGTSSKGKSKSNSSNMSALEKRRNRYTSTMEKRRGMGRKEREREAMRRMELFKEELVKGGDNNDEDKEKDDDNDEDGDEEDKDWKTHTLAFTKRPQDFLAHSNSLDDYEVYDPRSTNKNSTM